MSICAFGYIFGNPFIYKTKHIAWSSHGSTTCIITAKILPHYHGLHLKHSFLSYAKRNDIIILLTPKTPSFFFQFTPKNKTTPSSWNPVKSKWNRYTNLQSLVCDRQNEPPRLRAFFNAIWFQRVSSSSSSSLSMSSAS